MAQTAKPFSRKPSKLIGPYPSQSTKVNGAYTVPQQTPPKQGNGLTNVTTKGKASRPTTLQKQVKVNVKGNNGPREGMTKSAYPRSLKRSDMPNAKNSLISLKNTRAALPKPPANRRQRRRP